MKDCMVKGLLLLTALLIAISTMVFMKAILIIEPIPSPYHLSLD